MMVLCCVSVYTEMGRDSDRPMTCTNDFGRCMPTVVRSDPATPQTVHAIYVAAAIALVGLVVLLVCSRVRAPAPARDGGGILKAHGADRAADTAAATTLLDHNDDRNTSHD